VSVTFRARKVAVTRKFPKGQVMKAFVIDTPGGAENLVPKEIKIPEVKPGWILVKVKAFGLNRSEWFTRVGQSPSVKFPRVLGIECVGEIAASLDSAFRVGEKVAALMGGMGRDFDGSYAEFVLVPKQNVLVVRTTLDWEVFGALPEMLQTTHGSLYQGLEIKPEQTLLIRGGTSSIGLCALELARIAGLHVISTTRSENKISLLKKHGAVDVILEQAGMHEIVRRKFPAGIDCVLELIGTKTLLDSLRMAKRGGIVCMTGILGGEWELQKFQPMEDIPTAVKLTSYAGGAEDLSPPQLQRYLEQVEQGQLNFARAVSFSFAQLPEAHRLMDSNAGNGKIVITV
jgi:NADPH2:quinone reductase